MRTLKTITQKKQARNDGNNKTWTARLNYERTRFEVGGRYLCTMPFAFSADTEADVTDCAIEVVVDSVYPRGTHEPGVTFHPVGFHEGLELITKSGNPTSWSGSTMWLHPRSP